MTTPATSSQEIRERDPEAWELANRATSFITRGKYRIVDLASGDVITETTALQAYLMCRGGTWKIEKL